MKQYTVNEQFLSLQGEGMRAGTVNIFTRFTGCNLKCSVEPGPLSPGFFNCDTEFASGRKMTAEEIVLFARKLSPTCNWMILTGGEPGLQVDDELIAALHGAGYRLAIETNGTIALPSDIDWVTLSPKVAEHAVKQLDANEIKYVRGLGQAIPKPAATAEHKLISPAFEGNHLDKETLQWCINLVKENPEWRLSVQLHKSWVVR